MLLNQIGAPAEHSAPSISTAGKAFDQSTVSMAEISMSSPPPATAILTLSSPEVVVEEGEEWSSGDNFLEKCYYCNRRIGEKDEVFMYR